MAGKSTPSLDSLEEYVQQRYQNEKEKLTAMHVQRDVHRAHSEYLTRQMPSQSGSSSARSQAQSWANKHGIKGTSKPRAPDRFNLRTCTITSEASTSRDTSASRDTSTSNNKKVSTFGGLRESRMTRTLTESPASLPLHLPSTVGEEIQSTTKIYKCPIIMCEAFFSSDAKRQKHLRTYDDHTPCHPYKHICDLDLHWVVKEYRCPVCCKKFENDSLCMDHMIKRDHRILEIYKPVQVTAYACPQCFLVYTTAESCREHMAETDHVNYTYGFPDDPVCAEPLLLPPSILAQYVEACREVEWHLECIDCRYQLLPEEDVIRLHINKFHNVMALSETTLKNVFQRFQKMYTCVQCQVLFQNLPPVGLGGLHHCDDHNLGIIVENDCTRSKQYMLRLTFTRPGCSSSEFLEDPTSERNNNEWTGSGKLDSSQNLEETDEVPKIQHFSSFDFDNILQVDNVLPSSASGISDSAITISDISKTPQQASKRLCQTLNVDPESSRSSLSSPDAKFVNEMRNTCQKRKLSSSPKDDNCKKKKIKVQTNIDKCKEIFGPHFVVESSSLTELHLSQVVDLTADLSIDETLNPEMENIQESLKDSSNIKNDYATPSKHVSSPSLERESEACSSKVAYHTQNTSNRAPPKSKKKKERKKPSGTSDANCQQLSAESKQTRREETLPTLMNIDIPMINSSSNSLAQDKIPKNLNQMKHILFLDLDNWPKFFHKLPQALPGGTFVWAFLGGHTTWKTPFKSEPYCTLLAANCFCLHERCGRTKNAADFAMMLYIGKMDERLPKSIPFSILSGDKGFYELERQMESSERHAVIIDPHHRSVEELLTLIYSVTDISK